MSNRICIRECIFLCLLSVIVLVSIFVFSNSVHAGLSLLYYHNHNEEIVFEPGLKREFSYIVKGSPEKRIEVYAKGDLAEYIEFDKTNLTGEGNFKATLRLPEEIEEPGLHVIMVRAREIPEEAAGVIGVVAVGSPIKVFVPYPGKYVEVSMTTDDVNVGEPARLQVEVIGRGKEDVNVNVDVEIYGLGERIETLNLGEALIKSQERKVFERMLDTSNYNPGVYNAVAIVEYGMKEPVKVEKGFRIGSLFVNITNYTKVFRRNTISRFNVEVESNWNNKIENIYANITISDLDSKLISSFKTTPAELEAWKRKILTGFFETYDVKPGEYNANISLLYENAASSKVVRIWIKASWWYHNKMFVIIGSAVFLLMILVFYFIRKGIKKKNEQRFAKNEKQGK